MHRGQAPSFIFFLPFFFVLFLKLLIGVPSGNHDVLSSRSDLTLNSVHLSQVSIGFDEQGLEQGRPAG